MQSPVPIYALSPNVASRRRMALFRDVYPVAHHPEGKDMDRAIGEVLRLLYRLGHVHAGDRVIVTMGERIGDQGGTNTLRLVQIGAGGSAENPFEIAHG